MRRRGMPVPPKVGMFMSRRSLFSRCLRLVGAAAADDVGAELADVVDEAVLERLLRR